MVLVSVLGLNIFFLLLQKPHEVIFVLLVVGILTVFGWMQLWFAYLSKFDDTIWALLRNTFRIAIDHLPRVLLLIAFAAAAIAGFYVSLAYVSPFVLFIPGAYLMLAGSIIRGIFSSYLPLETT